MDGLHNIHKLFKAARMVIWADTVIFENAKNGPKIDSLLFVNCDFTSVF